MSRLFQTGIVALVITAGSAGNAKETISMAVSPSVAFAPAELVIRTSIEPDADNRTVEIVADSSNFYRSSEIPLEGDRAPRTTTIEFHGVPPGEYEVTATVMGAGGHRRALTRARVRVLGSND